MLLGLVWGLLYLTVPEPAECLLHRTLVCGSEYWHMSRFVTTPGPSIAYFDPLDQKIGSEASVVYPCNPDILDFRVGSP